MKKLILLFALFIGIFFLPCAAQDFAFSQYHLTPFVSNPAGVVMTNEIQFSLHYRYQGIASGNSYTTPMFSIAYPFMKRSEKNETWGGLGLSIITDNQGDFLKTTGALFAFDKHFTIKNSILSLGLQGGYFQKRIDVGNVITYNQIASGVLDEALITDEFFENLQVSYPVFSTGLLWYGLDNQNLTKYFVGFAANIVNQPRISFFDSKETNDASIKLPRNLTFSAGLRLFSKNRISLMPNARLIHRLGTNHINIGTWLHYQMLGNQNLLKQGQVSLGAWYHSNKTGVFSLEIQQPKYFAALSFDVGASPQTNEWMNNPTWEMTIGFKLARKSKTPKKKEENIQDTLIPYTLQKNDTLFIQKEDSIFIKVKQLFTAQNRKDSVSVFEIKKIIKNNDLSGLIIDSLIVNAEISIDTVRFEYGSDNLDLESQQILDNLTAILQKYPKYDVILIGHTSDDGDEGRNLNLSLNRANSVKQYLLSKNILEKRITVRGLGEYEPVDSNETESGRSLNRRVEIILVESED